MKSRGIAAVFALKILLCAGIAGAQPSEETLTDVRFQLEELRGELLALQSELRMGADQRAAQDLETGSVPESVLLRLDALEAELRRNIGKIERLESKIQTVLRQGSIQLRDLELRLVELEGGDVSQIDWGMTLGGVSIEQPMPALDPVEPDIASDEQELRERRSFQAAKAAFASGDHPAAEVHFSNFIAEFPESAYAGEAHFYLGESLYLKQRWQQAAKSFLESYQTSINSPLEPRAALRLAESLNQMGKLNEACQIFDVITEEFPGTEEARAARLGRSTIGCA